MSLHEHLQSLGPKLLGFTRFSVVTIKQGFISFLAKIAFLLHG